MRMMTMTMIVMVLRFEKMQLPNDCKTNREMTDLESTVATLEENLKMVNENYVGLR